MRAHIETQVRTAQLFFQATNTRNQFARVRHVIFAPVVGKNIEGILVTTYVGFVPTAISVSNITSQGIKQIAIDVDLWKNSSQLDRLHNPAGNEVVGI